MCCTVAAAQVATLAVCHAAQPKNPVTSVKKAAQPTKPVTSVKKVPVAVDEGQLATIDKLFPAAPNVLRGALLKATQGNTITTALQESALQSAPDRRRARGHLASISSRRGKSSYKYKEDEDSYDGDDNSSKEKYEYDYYDSYSYGNDYDPGEGGYFQTRGFVVVPPYPLTDDVIPPNPTQPNEDGK